MTAADIPTMDFDASNKQQQQNLATFQDKRFNGPVQMLKIPVDMQTLRFDVLPVSNTLTHGLMKEHRLGGSVITCPTTVGKDCPLCTAIQNNRNDDWYWQTFKARDRALFNVITLRDGKPHKLLPNHNGPVYLYEVSAPTKKAQGFWLLLTGALGSTDPEDAYKRKFCDWKEGCTLKLSFVKDSFNGTEFAKVSNLEFIRPTAENPRCNYAANFDQVNPTLYKIPDIYAIPEPEELQAYVEAMVRQRNSGYAPQVMATTAPQHGFYANSQVPNSFNPPAVGTTAWAANDANGEVW